jgi:hypothetical protein
VIVPIHPNWMRTLQAWLAAELRRLADEVEPMELQPANASSESGYSAEPGSSNSATSG